MPTTRSRQPQATFTYRIVILPFEGRHAQSIPKWQANAHRQAHALPAFQSQLISSKASADTIVDWS